MRGHRMCSDQLTTQYFPTRVLDLEMVDGQELKLVQDMDICAPYLALSHRWGLEELPRTTSINLARRLERLTLPELTPTMQDAVRVTRSLGFRYLWIDALCIIQDSEEDWLREAAKMSEVFSGATITIAVADSENHSQGMFRASSYHELLVPSVVEAE
jgi:hypothetical protein